MDHFLISLFIIVHQPLDILLQFFTNDTNFPSLFVQYFNLLRIFLYYLIFLISISLYINTNFCYKPHT